MRTVPLIQHLNIKTMTATENKTVLKFGKFKGLTFEQAPKWYQQWLLQQDWFNMPIRPTATDSYALVENGVIHTEDLTLEKANEMKQRHHRCFPDCTWEVLPMSALIGLDKAEGMLERHMRVSAKYA
jgi:hypothetical protein